MNWDLGHLQSSVDENKIAIRIVTLTFNVPPSSHEQMPAHMYVIVASIQRYDRSSCTPSRRGVLIATTLHDRRSGDHCDHLYALACAVKTPGIAIMSGTCVEYHPERSLLDLSEKYLILISRRFQVVHISI